MNPQRPGIETGEVRTELRNRLAQSLPGCRAATIDALTDLARVRHLQPGHSIYKQGEHVPLTLILRGYGVAERTTEDGRVIISGIAPAGVLFGFSGIASALSSVEISSLTECEVAQWRGSEFRALVVEDPGLALVAIDSMAASLHQTIERIEGFLHQDARRRVLRILSRHRPLFFDEPTILTRAHLPNLVGTSREMTGRVLRQLEREGTIERFGSTGLRLLRPDALDLEERSRGVAG